MAITRRSLLKTGALAGAAGMLGLSRLAWPKSGSTGTSTKSGKLFGYMPFTQPLFIPAALTPLPFGTLSPTPTTIFSRGPRRPRGICDDVAHGIAPEFGLCSDWNAFNDRTHEVEYSLFTEETTQRFVPGGPDTPVFTYRDGTAAAGSGRTPGPTVIADFRAPVVLRNCNLLTRNRSGVNTTHHDHETSIHLHGSHTPAHADGYPEFYVLAGEARDYFYPNIAPRVTQPNGLAEVCSGDFDETWIESTAWYHDHAMDVTGFNVSRGLAGFYLAFDERERQLIADHVLPDSFATDGFGNPLDIGLALVDQRFNADGTLFYDFLDHNGRLGDVFTVNGTVQPFLDVERRKYRFRFLNASNARIYRLRLSTRQPFLVFGADTWLFPRAGLVPAFEVAMGQRHDVIIDFRNAPDEVFLENILIQTDGRKGDKVDPSRPTPLLKFNVMGSPVANDVTVTDGTVIRGFAGVDPDGQWAPIPKRAVVATRTFRFDRANGAFTVNNRFFNPRRADAVPELGRGAERWFFENNSGGWWHPIHTHLEGFQIQKLNGKRPPFERSFNSDLVLLHGGEAAEVLLKFRTFTGPFVFHCHNAEHEDMRMMGVHDPTPGAGGVAGAIDATPPLDGETRIDPAVSGVVPDCEELEADGRIFFDEAGDVDRVADRGVGFPECEFDNDLRGNRR